MKLCIVDQCGRKHFGRGWCKLHYNRMRNGGSLEPVRSIGNPKNYRQSGRDGLRLGVHVMVAERALGKSLPEGAIVHHVNHIRSDNRNSNLVICPDSAYHHLLHSRERALDGCGHADWLHCWFCKQWSAPEELVLRPDKRQAMHRDCIRKQNLEAKERARARRLIESLCKLDEAPADCVGERDVVT